MPESSKRTDRQALSAKLLNDEEYRKNLLTRLRAGMVSPQLEVLLWHYWLGKPADEVVLTDQRDLAGKSDDELKAMLRAKIAELQELTESESVH